MDSTTFDRARKLLDARPGSALTANAFGVVHALLLLALFVVAGLLMALFDTRGETIVENPPPPHTPKWIAEPLASRDRGTVLLTGTGLSPVVMNNLVSHNPAHHWGARALESAQSALPPLRTNRDALVTLCLLALILFLAAWGVRQLRRSVLVEAATKAADTLRRQIHRQMYRLGQSALPSEGISPIVNLFTREVNDVRDGLYSHMEHGLSVPIVAIGLFLIAAVVSLPLALLLVSLGGLLWLAARPLNRQAWLRTEAASRDSALQLSLLHEDLGLLRTVRVFGMEGVDSRRFDEHMGRFQEAEVRGFPNADPLSPASQWLIGVAAIFAVGLLGYNVLNEQVAPSGAAVLLIALIALAKPLSDWLMMRRKVRQATRSAGALFEFLERKPELQQTGGAQPLPRHRERITFENVSLGSPSGRPLLEGISAEIPARSRTAVMSRDEDSKHALVCLIPRLIDPKVGRVRIDGHDLRAVTLESVRAQVATVLESDLVFSDSVAANIGLGHPKLALPRVIEAAKTVHAHNFIQDLPQGYDTIIGPLGHYLRPDEQYRIALARALLHDPSIVIIEEPAAGLDDDTKHLVDGAVAELTRDRTVIFLPHRLSTIRSCDQVIVLLNGRIEAMGSPRALQAESKVYRHLQYVEFNQFATGEIEAGQMSA